MKRGITTEDLYNKLNYKIGQKIYLKPYSKIDKFFKQDIQIKKYYNKSATITSIEDDNKGYFLNIDDGQFIWFEVEFEKIKTIRKNKLKKIYKKL